MTLPELPPILAAPLFAQVEDKLLELLRSLAPVEWDRPAVGPQWRVKEVVAHLLDTHLRKLSMARDGCFPPAPPLESPAALLAFVNRLNAEGVAHYSRLSTAVLISLMETAAHESVAFHLAQDPFAPAVFAVSWAGESLSLNWFDTARELTERWHHQQQIRLALHRPGIMTPELYHPVLDCFLRALPFQYRDVTAPAGTGVQICIAGDCGGVWNLHRLADRWQLSPLLPDRLSARVVIPQEIAWRLFTKGIAPEEATRLVTLEGDPALSAPVLAMIAIVG